MARTVYRNGRLTNDTRIDGLTEVKARLAALPEAFREVMAESIRGGAAIIETEAKRRVRKKERDLMRDIKTNIRGDGLQAAVGTGLAYGRWLEFGTSRQSPRPWLYPSFRRGARHIRREMRGWVPEAGHRVRFKTKRQKAKA